MHNECVDSQCFNQYFNNLYEIYCVVYILYVRNISREDITMCNLTGWSTIRMDYDGLSQDGFSKNRHKMVTLLLPGNYSLFSSKRKYAKVMEHYKENKTI